MSRLLPASARMHASPHWYVSRLRVRGFKSFGSEWAEVALPSPHLVGLVGPNGTGKSNLLEAMMFAAGAAATDLRARTLRDLCNADLKQLCEVEVQFSHHLPQQQLSQALASGKAKQDKHKGHAPGHEECHWVRAALTPDGARAFQLDGRTKTAQQVKDVLRGLGIHLDAGMSVIRQAAVTRLADSNTPAAVTTVIAAASGLARWTDETSRAASELAAAQKALKDIHTNLRQLRVLIKADGSRAEQAAAAQQLELQVSLTATRLATAHTKQREATMTLMLGAQTDLANTEDQLDALQEQLVHVSAQLEDLQQQHRLQDKVSHQPSVLQQVKRVATLEEQVRAAAVQLQQARTFQQRHIQLTAELVPLQLREASALAAVQAADAQFQNLQAALSMDTELEVAGQDAAAYLEQLESQANSSKAYAQQLEDQHAQRTAELQAAQQQLSTCRVQLECVRQQHAAQQEATQLGIAGASYQEQARQSEARLQAAQDQLSLCTVRLRVLQTQLGLKAHPAAPKAQANSHTASRQWGASTASGSTAAGYHQTNGTAAGTAGLLPARLHTLFSFKEQPSSACLSATPLSGHKARGHSIPVRQLLASSGMPSVSASGDRQHPPAQTHAEFWCRALSVIVGSSLDVLVVANAVQASHVLQDITQAVQAYGPAVCVRTSSNHAMQPGKQGAAGDTLRIWPLDRITVTDRTAAQRAAQAALGPERVILPLDLLEYPAHLHPAMLRAFGGCVLASDSPTAAQLAQQYGLAAVTPDGTISRRGSVSGGYLGPATGAPGRPVSGPEAVLAAKIEMQEAQMQYRMLSDEVDTARLALEAVHQQHKQAEAAAARLHASAARLSDAQRTMDAAQARMAACTSAVDLAAAQHRAALQAMDRCTAALTTASQKLNGNSNQDAVILQLQRQQLQHAQQQVQSLQAEHAQVLQQLQQLQAEVDMLAAQQDSTRSHAVDASDGGNSNRDQAELSPQPEWGVDTLVVAHEEAKMKLEEAEEQLRQARQAAKDATQAQKERQKQLQQLHARRDTLQQDIQAGKQRLSQHQQHMKAHQHSLAQLAASIARLAEEHGVSLKPSVTTSTSAADRSDDAAGVDIAGQVGQLQGKLQQLMAQRQALGNVQDLSSTEQVRSRARIEDMQLFEQRAAMLEAGVVSLQEGMHASQQQVLSAHNVVYDAIRARFQQLCAMLLPSMKFTLGSVDSGATCTPVSNAPFDSKKKQMAGMQLDSKREQETAAVAVASGTNHVMLFKRQPADAAAVQSTGKNGDSGEDDGASWLSCLEQLSGVMFNVPRVAHLQVSLALLLAAAWEGSRSSVILLDEVDAALDEANQHAVAQLLAHLAHGTLDAATDSGSKIGGSKQPSMLGRPTSGIQVVCVSHQPAFQKACDALVQVSRQGNGTQAAAPAAAAAASSKVAAASKAVAAAAHGEGAPGLGSASAAEVAPAQPLRKPARAASTNTRKRTARNR